VWRQDLSTASVRALLELMSPWNMLETDIKTTN
jgi:hypothetical protein